MRRHLMTARIDQRNGTGNGTIYHAPEAKLTSVKRLKPENVYLVDNSPFPAKTEIATISLKNLSENHDPYIILMLKKCFTSGYGLLSLCYVLQFQMCAMLFKTKIHYHPKLSSFGFYD